MSLDFRFQKAKKETKNLKDFRKVNFLERYFEDIGYDLDNCIPCQIDREDIKELIRRCEQVLKNNELAKELLPTRNSYDIYYFQDVKEVLNFCKEKLLPEFNNLKDHEWIEFELVLS